MKTSMRILVASDLHGSNACFRKLIGLVRETNPDVVVIAGDFTGKHTHHIAQREQGWERLENGRWIHVPSISAQLRGWGDVGQYWSVVRDTDQLDTERLEEASLGLQVARVQKWIEYADAELSTLRIPCFVIPGNDDSDEVANALGCGRWVRSLDMRAEELGGLTFAGLGYSNPTPWATWRELSEADILSHLERLPISDPERTVLVVHVPPHRSGLDIAPALVHTPEGELKVVPGAYINVGSTSLATYINDVAPMLVISGHCHTSHGVRRMGQTSCANPGSSYNTATLNALMLVRGARGVVGFQPLVR